MKFAAIREQEKAHPIAWMCRILGVSRGGYYAWRGRDSGARALEDRRLAVEVKAAFEENRGLGRLLWSELDDVAIRTGDSLDEVAIRTEDSLDKVPLRYEASTQHLPPRCRTTSPVQMRRPAEHPQRQQAPKRQGR